MDCFYKDSVEKKEIVLKLMRAFSSLKDQNVGGGKKAGKINVGLSEPAFIR